MRSDGKVNILLVDDKPDKLVALEAVLEDLGQNTVRAASGREALRHLLNGEFAVILLDINMPGMDGFETASLIRQRRATRDVPIIFITAYGEADHIARGYSLGAVDYLMAPVLPDVLKTKVSVFVELARKNQQIRRQAEWMRSRAEQLHRLTAASLAINSALSIETLSGIVAETARELVNAQRSSLITVPDGKWAAASVVHSCAESHPRPGRPQRPDANGVAGMVYRSGRPVRLGAQPENNTTARTEHGGGLVAVPLTRRDGQTFGVLEVTDPTRDAFDDDDESILVQLAQMASIAIENAMFAEERETNRTKDEFLWMLSHELRTPLNAILGWTQLLKLEGLDGEVQHGIDVIERNAVAQTKLIEDLLDISRITTGKFHLSQRLLTLQQVVDAAVDTALPAAQAKQIELVNIAQARNEQIKGDPNRLQQVVGNLLSNALKFTPSGGRIEVATECVGTYVQIRVRDNGRGISPAFLPHVFDRFRQADSTSTRSHGGLGIGLTIVRHIVELHGGSVRADSAGEGHGTTFSVLLPLTAAARDADEPSAPTADDRSPLPSLRGVRALVVDDDPDCREIVRTMLTQAGAVVTLAGSAEEAMEVLNRESLDVLISDIAMPQRDGYGLLNLVRNLPAERNGAIPAVALTAYAREADRCRALDAGFRMHVPKPVSAPVLVRAVAQAMEQHADAPADERVRDAVSA